MDATLDTEMQQPTVIRTERGLTIAGTRKTLYQVMDCLKEDWPPRPIRSWMDLSERQMEGVLEYIESYREEVEAEYAYVLRRAEENRQYWEARNQERLAAITTTPPSPGHEELRNRIQEWKRRRSQEK
jgi:hypothetical protein